MKTGNPTSPGSQKPALTIIVEEWMTPIVGIVMLIIGLVIGFIVRPFFTGVEAVVPQPSRTGQQVQQEPGNLFLQNATRDPMGMMDNSAQLARHWLGNPAAPIRMVEFADYQ
jgi:hypothetical protein